MPVEILEGSAALARAQDPTFVAAWRVLYDACPWATVGQHPDFVRIAYEVYGRVEPGVLVVGSDGGGLSGLLALVRQDGVLAHVAPTDCEYHQWLARPSEGDAFMTEAVRAVRKKLGPLRIELPHLVPEAPIGWTQGGTDVAALCEVAPLVRRIIRTRDPEKVRAYLRGKSRLRTTANKLKRSGDVRVRRVEDPGEIVRLVDQLVPMFELRKGAAFGVLPFRDMPLRRDFLVAQAAVAGLLHLVVLERDGKVLAAHLASNDGRVLNVAGIVHDELEAHHSPASVMLLDLVEMLCRDGYEMLDLTPGEQEYKTRMGDEVQDDLHAVVVHASRLERERRRAKKWLAPRVKEAFERLPPPWRGRAEKGVAAAKALARRVRSDGPDEKAAPVEDQATRLLAHGHVAPLPDGAGPPSGLTTASGITMSRNELSDLSRFGGSRDAYLELLRNVAAFARARGEMYTFVRDEKLVAVWFVLPAASFAAAPTSVEHVLCEVDGPFAGPARPGGFVEMVRARLPETQRKKLGVVELRAPVRSDLTGRPSMGAADRVA